MMKMLFVKHLLSDIEISYKLNIFLDAIRKKMRKDVIDRQIDLFITVLHNFLMHISNFLNNVTAFYKHMTDRKKISHIDKLQY